MKMQMGNQSLRFAEAPFIISSANIVGKKEGEGPLGELFDVVGEDDTFGQDTWEEAESTLQKEAFTIAVGKAGLESSQIRYLFAGDLLGQTIATSFGVVDFEVPQRSCLEKPNPGRRLQGLRPGKLWTSESRIP